MSLDEALGEAIVKLRAAAAADRHVEAAQMRLINLTDIIRASGSNWRRTKEAISLGSISFLRGCLEEEDIVIPCGDGFLIIFASTVADEVTRKTEEIRQLLILFYLGQQGLDRLNVHASRTTLQPSVLQALAANELTIEDAQDEPVTSRRFAFAPIWHVQKQVIISHFCTPVCDGADGPIYAYDPAFVETGVGEPSDFLATDIEALERVDAHLQVLRSGALQPALGVPVHASTMQRRARRTQYLKRLDQVVPDHARRLSVRISEIPHGTPITTIADWVGLLRGSVRTILLQFHHSEPPPIQVERSGATGAGFYTPRRACKSKVELSRFLHQVELWAATLARQRMILYVDNVGQMPLAKRAIELGAHLLTSDALWPVAEQPGEARYAPLASAGRSLR